MHSQMFCELILDFTLRPTSPLLIKSGDEDALDPTLPDMQFVRTYDVSSDTETVFIPGASLKGVVRSHAERLVRSQNPHAACDPLRKSSDVPDGFRGSCSLARGNQTDLPGDEAYRKACYTCRLFGSTAVASRILFSDMMPDQTVKPIMGERKGVAIDRVTGAVLSGGLFEMEVMHDAIFHGRLVIRNFTIGQLGLVGGSLLDVSDGLVPIGFGKSKGFGRVSLSFKTLHARYPLDTDGHIWGVGNVAPQETLNRYGLGAIHGKDGLESPTGTFRRAGLYSVSVDGDQPIRLALENAAARWPAEVAGLVWGGGN